MRSTPSGAQEAGQRDRVVAAPAALDPVGGRDAHEERELRRPDRADGAHDLEQEAGSGPRTSRPSRRSPVRQRREERVGQQVAVRGVELEDIEARPRRAARGRRERRRPRPSSSAPSSAAGTGWPGANGNGPGPTGRPAALARCERPAALPRRRRGGLASGVGELEPRHRALRLHEGGDPRQRLGVGVAPEAEVGGRDPPLGEDRGRLGDDQPGAAHRAAPEVHEVPVRRHSVDAGVLAHGRHADAVAERRRRAAGAE